MLHPNVIYLSAKNDRAEAEVAMQYNTSYNELVLSFATTSIPPTAAPMKKGSGPA